MIRREKALPDSYSKCNGVGPSPFPSEPSVAASSCRRFLARVKVEPPGDLEGTLTRANGSAALFGRDGRAAAEKGVPAPFSVGEFRAQEDFEKTSRWSFGRLGFVKDLQPEKGANRDARPPSYTC